MLLWLSADAASQEMSCQLYRAPRWAKNEPDSAENGVQRLRGSRVLSLTDKCHENSPDLIRTQGAFHFCLIVPHKVDALFGNPLNSVEDQDVMLPPVKYHISPSGLTLPKGRDYGFIPSRHKQRIHAVPLRMDPDSMPGSQQFLDIFFRY
jgi:hypothetical protein